MQDDEVHIGAAKGVARHHRLFGVVDQAQVDQFDAGPLDALGDLGEIALQPLVQPLELGPVGVQANAKQANAHTIIPALFKLGLAHALLLLQAPEP